MYDKPEGQVVYNESADALVTSKAHLDVAAVVAAVPCWRLETGRDLPRLGRRIGDMVRVRAEGVHRTADWGREGS